jgi:hypothetical protein
MTVKYGFYNSVDHDRLYDSTDFGRMFDGILTDGVLSTFLDEFLSESGGGMVVNVKPGRAWFNGTWTYNDSILPLTVTPAHLTLARIDSVVLEIDKSLAIRQNSIKIIAGTPSVTPSAPVLETGPEKFQYALAHITVPAGASSLTSGNITSVVGSFLCPYSTFPPGAIGGGTGILELQIFS